MCSLTGRARDWEREGERNRDRYAHCNVMVKDNVHCLLSASTDSSKISDESIIKRQRQKATQGSHEGNMRAA